MIKFENTYVGNFEGALRGMRNPLNSWRIADSKYCLPNMCHGCINKCGSADNDDIDWEPYQIGINDLDLAKRLINGGSEHRKYLRQIFVSVDITAPLYWWKQFDTYKIGTTSNSCSTMHKIHAKEFSAEDFSYEDMTTGGLKTLSYIIESLNVARRFFLNSNNKDMSYWNDMIKILPEAYNQKRTITMNYENLYSMCKQRKGHKLKEWKDFVEWVKTLPYSKDLIFLK